MNGVVDQVCLAVGYTVVGFWIAVGLVAFGIWVGEAVQRAKIRRAVTRQLIEIGRNVRASEANLDEFIRYTNPAVTLSSSWERFTDDDAEQLLRGTT